MEIACLENFQIDYFAFILKLNGTQFKSIKVSG